jgi:hypothetical protein
MDLKAKEELYEVLFRIADQTLDHFNPCDWKNGKCRRMRSIKDDAGCCSACIHLGKKGCTVKSLACKLWLCGKAADPFKACVAELRMLRLIAEYCYIPCDIRKSKEENFELVSGHRP